ncbi:inorganic pyrophosphatase [Streptoalloteichus hindustanus]|uniref:Inorganic pyrophosphatase n=1 Tax=Streptoalloteichus hindustanus TaxID=2017 RepID=A0A1M5GSX2_STRHI|nr:inorganic pyrophosphatase [Streptoalloteichus hindustanus]SHG06771.1 inorganic pyrophosphatase [Streptoalloteichus hindustanus]
MGDFFALLDALARGNDLVVDRPRGRPHPRIPEAVYPLDYGHLLGTRGGDGAEVDVFVGSARGLGVVGVLLTTDLAKGDVETKVLLDCTADEIAAARAFCADVLRIGGELVPRPPPSPASSPSPPPSGTR